MMEHAYRKAKKLALKKLYVLSTQTAHWFIERGFQPTDFNHLPEPLKILYNPERNSKILVRDID
jgi:amino-acid N-acetyltransferase